MHKKIPIKIILLLSSIYFISQFYRASLGTITYDIESEYFLNPEKLGRLGGIFFLAFAFTQIPLGILLDYYNPLKVIISMLLTVYLGTIIISYSDSYASLMIGRGLQGVGCGVCLMGPLVFLSKNYAKKKFSEISGYIMGIGGLGALAATQPFYTLTLIVEWKKSYFFTSFIILFLVLGIFYLISYEKDRKLLYKNKLNLKSYYHIISSKNFLYMLPMSFFGYASFAFLLTLWGAEYLEKIQKMNSVNISKTLMFMALFWTLGSFFYGLLLKKIDRKKSIVIISALFLVFLLLVLLFFHNLSSSIILLIFGLLGFVGAFTLVVIAQYRSLFSSHIIGKVLTTANFFNFLGVFFVQWSTGAIMHFSKTRLLISDNKTFVMAFLAVVFYLFLSTYFYFKINEKLENEEK